MSENDDMKNKLTNNENDTDSLITDTNNESDINIEHNEQDSQKQKKSFFTKKEPKVKEKKEKVKKVKEDPYKDMDPAKAKQYKKYLKKLRLRKIANSIMGFIIFCALLGCLSGYSIIKTVIDKTDVVLETEDLASKDSSLIYDDAGNLIATIGQENRISYSYNKMPQALIDAFVAVEDSRYFEHSGFDIPRFAKAVLENIKAFSFAQGGSTITMQVIKNTYFAVDTIAEKSVGRKIQEIYFSLKITGEVSKEKIIEMYINKVNYGYTARGAQTAANYYFNKNVNELSLVECAMLAGVINMPNWYNPYVDLKACQDRTRDVLYQMYNHGYLSEEEYFLAKKVKIEDLLCDDSTQYSSKDGDYIDNQAYIDVVLDEIEDVYGINPYETPVKIYTGMNATVQAACDAIAKGEVSTFKDDYINCSASVTQNYTGLIVGICGGRYYNAERIFNYAKDGRTSPGSTSKAIITYPLAFEYCGMATTHVIVDEPYCWQGTDIVVGNDDGTYHGQVSVQRSFPQSYNIPSMKLYHWIQECAGNRAIYEYLAKLEFDDVVLANLNDQYSLGCNGFDVSTIQMSAAESMILSGGLYTTPHTITKIEFINGNKEPIYANYTSVRALSAEAAWLASYLQNIGVDGGANSPDYITNGRLRRISKSGIDVYGKTGTNGYDWSVDKAWGYPSNASKEMFYVAGTNDYAIAFWHGYDTGRYQDETTYLSSAYTHSNPDVPFVNALLNSTLEAFGNPTNTNSRPSGVTTITHILGVYPYTAPVEGSSATTITGYIKSSEARLTTWEAPTTIYNPEKFTAEFNSDTNVLTYSISEYPDVEMTKPVGKTYEIMSYDGTTKEADGDILFDSRMIDGVIKYHIDIYNKKGEWLGQYETDQPTGSTVIELATGKTVKADDELTIWGYYVYEICRVQSSPIEVSVKAKGTKISPSVPVVSNTSVNQ